MSLAVYCIRRSAIHNFHVDDLIVLLDYTAFLYFLLGNNACWLNSLVGPLCLLDSTVECGYSEIVIGDELKSRYCA